MGGEHTTVERRQETAACRLLQLPDGCGRSKPDKSDPSRPESCTTYFRPEKAGPGEGCVARCVQVVEAASHSGKPEGRPVPIYNNVVSEQLLFERKTACRTAGKNIFGRRAKSAAMSVFLKNSLSERLRRALLALSCPFVAEPMLKIRFSSEKVKKYVKNLWGGEFFSYICGVRCLWKP